MKTKILIIGFLLAALPAFADQVSDLYNKGVTHMNQGNVAEAEEALLHVLKLSPNHPYARHKLIQLRNNKNIFIARKKEAELKNIILPNVSFEDVALSEAVQVINLMVEQESAKKLGEDKAITPNLLIQDPNGSIKEKTINLRLKGVPATTVLQYVLDQAGATVQYDTHAAIIRPAAPAGVPATKKKEKESEFAPLFEP